MLDKSEERFIENLLNGDSFVPKAKLVYPKLMPGQAKLLNLLVHREMVTLEGLVYVFSHYTYKTIHGYIHYIRKYTKAQITNHYGIGYSMKPEDRKRIKQEIENVRL